MLLTRACRYGILAMTSLIEEPGEGRRHLARDVARIHKIPPEYLAKIMTELVKAGLVTSLRGPSGGYTLVRKPRQISVADIITAIDGDITDVGDPKLMPPKVRRVIADRMKQVSRVFEEVTLSDLGS